MASTVLSPFLVRVTTLLIRSYFLTKTEYPSIHDMKMYGNGVLTYSLKGKWGEVAVVRVRFGRRQSNPLSLWD